MARVRWRSSDAGVGPASAFDLLVSLTGVGAKSGNVVGDVALGVGGPDHLNYRGTPANGIVLRLGANPSPPACAR